MRNGDGLVQQLGWQHLRGLEADEALDHQRNGQDGAKDERPDRPAGSNYDRKQEPLRPRATRNARPIITEASGRFALCTTLSDNAHKFCG